MSENFYPLPQYEENTSIFELDPHEVRPLIEKSLANGINVPLTIAQNLFGFTGWSDIRGERFLKLLELYKKGDLEIATTLVNFYYENLPMFESGITPHIKSDFDTFEVVGEFVKKQHPNIKILERLDSQNLYSTIYSILYKFTETRYITGVGYAVGLVSSMGTKPNPHSNLKTGLDKIRECDFARNRMSSINSIILVFLTNYANIHKISKISTLFNSLLFIANYSTEEWNAILINIDEIDDPTLANYDFETSKKAESASYFLDNMFNLDFKDRLLEIKIKMFEESYPGQPKYLGDFISGRYKNIIELSLHINEGRDALMGNFEDSINASAAGFRDLKKGKITF